jgi:hypothetical protein
MAYPPNTGNNPITGRVLGISSANLDVSLQMGMHRISAMFPFHVSLFVLAFFYFLIFVLF